MQILSAAASKPHQSLALRLLLIMAQEFVGPSRSAALLSARREQLQTLLQARLPDVLRVVIGAVSAAAAEPPTVVSDRQRHAQQFIAVGCELVV